MFPVTNIIERYWFMEKARESSLKQQRSHLNRQFNYKELVDGQIGDVIDDTLTNCNKERTWEDSDFPVSDSVLMDIKHKNLKRGIFRTLLVMLTGIVSLSVPNFGLFLSLVGAIANSLATFVWGC